MHLSSDIMGMLSAHMIQTNFLTSDTCGAYTAASQYINNIEIT